LGVKLHNRVLPLLLGLMLLAWAALPLLTAAPNRLLSGQAVPWATVLAGPGKLLALPFAVLMVLPWLAQTARIQALVAGCAALLLFGLTWLAGQYATRLSGGDDSLVRVAFGGAYWLLASLCWLAAADAIARATSHAMLRLLANLLVLAPPLALLWCGQLDQLAILKEYSNRADVFNDALLRHLLILLDTVIGALALGVPLGLAGFRYRRWRHGLFTVLNLIQTIPSIALFGLLIAPLAALARYSPWLAAHGVSGIGMTPAIIALVLYSLLPLARSVVAGLDQVPPAVVEAARGVGLTNWQVMWHVQLPLALPLLLSGLRVTAVQAVGLTVVAALIGAGGLGAIVFQGLLSSALDLVLLGVIPVVALAVLIDCAFKYLVASLELPHA